MLTRSLCLIAMIAETDAFRVPMPMGNMGRTALSFGASSMAAVSAPLIAHAKTIEEIAAESNARAAREAVAAAEAAAAGDPVGDIAAGALNLVLSGAIFALLAAVAFFLFQTAQDGKKAEASVFTKDPLGKTADGYKSTMGDMD